MRNQHNYNIRGSKEKILFKITWKTTTYYRAANDWNELLKNIKLESSKYLSSKLTFPKALEAYLLNEKAK